MSNHVTAAMKVPTANSTSTDLERLAKLRLQISYLESCRTGMIRNKPDNYAIIQSGAPDRMCFQRLRNMVHSNFIDMSDSVREQDNIVEPVQLL